VSILIVVTRHVFPAFVKRHTNKCQPWLIPSNGTDNVLIKAEQARSF